MAQRRNVVGWFLLITMAMILGSCDGCRRKARSKYYNSLEKIGLEKREVLVRRVDKARDAQENAQEQFEDALEQFQALVDYDGGELEGTKNSKMSSKRPNLERKEFAIVS